MPDPYKPVAPGEAVNFSARAWNAMLRAGKAQELREHNQESGAGAFLRQGSIIRIKNVSGQQLNRGSVLGLQSPIFRPAASPAAFMREVTFRGTLPSSLYMGKFCVALDPLDVGRIGRAYVDGVCQVVVDVKDNKHTCADVLEGDTSKLVTMKQGGSAEILWREGQDTQTLGPQWAIVRLGTNCKICCTSSSSSSSSSTSDGCPTNACNVSHGGGCEPDAPCIAEAVVQGLSSGDLACGNMNGNYFLNHIPDSCTWYAPDGVESGAGGGIPTGCTATLTWDGTKWEIEIVGRGHIAVFDSTAYNCHGIFSFDYNSAKSDCITHDLNQCTLYSPPGS